MRALFSGNVCENERIGSRWGARPGSDTVIVKEVIEFVQINCYVICKYNIFTLNRSEVR